ncbi:MAG: AAA-associated domain-containing protein [Nitrososphaerota archaeon]|nr:AAA-associated domain-containing protein [Candidatus Calditenuaceae archaeon]MDW8072874.1 AAA-associated domain-containing protein [Nitrososphaerota archaeon]
MDQQGPRCPLQVTPAMVAGLVEVLTLLKNRADVASIVSEVGMESGLVLEILEACEALGLVKIDQGDAILTEQGLSFSRRRYSGKIKMLRELVRNVEPFKSIIHHIGSRKEPLTVEQLCRELKLCDTDPESVSRAKSFLLDWLVTTGYLEYDGEAGLFKQRRGVKLS